MPHGSIVPLVGAWLLLSLAARAAEPTSPERIEFNRDIRLILSDNCYQCHGPDANQRQADLRLDVEASALAQRDGRQAIVPGDPEASELVRRITAADPDQRMPPPESGKSLTAGQVELLRRWISEGAAWQRHWSLIPPARPALPPVQDAAWVRSPIDSFVLARLEREGLAPSPEADRATLIRRLSLDLTGLPPTPAEVDAFLADSSPGAYERVVDRLLASPRFGERMASRWLDGARYADTSGYQSDGERYMWRWRDWVIDAYNANLPFDRFTREQLAGDLLPEPTLAQRIATGFNRNHRGNAEGGIVPEEYAVEYVADRVETTATVWLGMTLGCARCHDHKFDPFTQRDFYRLFAFFNNVPEKGRAIKIGNSPPYLPAPTDDELRQLAALDVELDSARQALAALEPELASAHATWEQSLTSAAPADWTVTRALAVHLPLDGDLADRAAEARSGACTDGQPAFDAGVLGQAGAFDGARFIDAGDVASFSFFDSFTLAAWVRADDGPGGTIVSRMTDAEEADGYALRVKDGRVQLNLIKRWLDDALRVESVEPLPAGWHHLAATYDGSRLATGVRLYLDGEDWPLRAVLDDLNQTFETKEPLRIGGGNGPQGRFHGLLDDVRVYADALSADEVRIVATPQAIADIAAQPADGRSLGQSQKLRACFIDQFAPAPLQAAVQRVGALFEQREALVTSFPTTMVMEEMPTPRETRILLRGDYTRPGEAVTPGVPATLSGRESESQGASIETQGPEEGLDPSGPQPSTLNPQPSRLDLADWLLAPDHPLTSRVAVNRLWQMCFGAGLVRTVDDFGSRGEPPTHPELLDWLATEFVRGGWDTKALQRQIVTSATYRQSSRLRPELRERDPDNRLLARGPRVRLSAEAVRDQALAASGLLVERLGGRSVMPYQPAGLWLELTGNVDYVQGHGADLYRRSLYTFWKRTVPPPAMSAFDAAGRETCIVRETRTNTPLQALTLMNDVTYVEAARALAERILQDVTRSPLPPGEGEGEGAPSAAPQSIATARLSHMFRLVLARAPREAELAVLQAGLDEHLRTFQADPAAAEQLVSAGESPRDPRLDVAELAAYTALASLVLNLDEAITKE
jgi:hypothetical protein